MGFNDIDCQVSDIRTDCWYVLRTKRRFFNFVMSVVLYNLMFKATCKIYIFFDHVLKLDFWLLSRYICVPVLLSLMACVTNYKHFGNV